MPARPAPRCLGSDWYAACLERLAELERLADRPHAFAEVLEPWISLCSAAADALNAEPDDGDG